MADTVVSDAVKFPQDEGYPNVSEGSETWLSAGFLGAITDVAGSQSFVHNGVTFGSHDGANDQFDLTKGRAFVFVDSVYVQSALGGSSEPNYDTLLTDQIPVLLELPTNETNLSATGSTLNDVWLAYATDGSVSGVSTGDVYVRHGSTVNTPPHPNVKIGQVNPDDSTQDVLVNRGPRPDMDLAILGQRSSAPSDSDYPAGSIAVYSKDDGDVYARVNGGTEETLSGGGGGALNKSGATPLGSSSTDDDVLEIPVGLIDGQSATLDYVYMAFQSGSIDSNIEARLLDTDGSVAGSVTLSSDPTIDTSPGFSTADSIGQSEVIIELRNTGGTDYYSDLIRYEFEWSKN